ncbi:MAG: response regulator [Planctomycetia bacterium]|nr:response regulator [Planctomycetia bacterium]
MSHSLSPEAQRLLRQHSLRNWQTTDRMFGLLLTLEWVVLIVIALRTSPTTWSGTQQSIHPHVWIAVFLGAMVVVPPLWLSRRYPGSSESRHAVAIGQSLICALFIHLTGGRIESHFPIFGSLACLAFYRDWRVLVTATIVTGLDHAVRGIYWPTSVFGIASTDSWRWLEHIGWVLYEDFFLIYACRRSLAEMTEIACREAEANSSALRMEAVVEKRTSELQESERHLRQSRDRAQAANIAKSEFLANMSHEIRTPMTAILGYTDLLYELGDISKAPLSRVDAIETIQRNGNHLLALLNDILDLSRIESGKLSVERLPYAPAAILREVEHLMQVRADEMGIELCVRSEGVVPASVVGDPTRIRQIITNLLGNAIKFTERGSVTVVARFASTPTSTMEIDVIDTGIGMTVDAQSRIFEPFVQADASTSRRFGGTGLGLIISRRLAALLGGDVSIVYSEPDVGTCFRLCLPIEIESVSPVADVGSVEEIVAKKEIGSTNWEQSLVEMKLLVAEDGLDNQRLIFHYLKRAGAETVLAENGIEAVAFAEAADRAGRPFDAVLMDMQMPLMDGYEATKSLRQHQYRGRIIAVTAHAMAGDKRQCIEAGCDDYLTKPIDRRQLIQVLATLQTTARSPSPPTTKSSGEPSPSFTNDMSVV